MIHIINKEECCGCNACVQRCPKSCIAMHKDEQGFLYPKVDLSLCIDCHLCEKVCPIQNNADERKPSHIYASKNIDDDVRIASSSGGVFLSLATEIIKSGGIVFGAKFDEDWHVVHDYTETIEGLKAFQGSKYIQSRISGTFKTAETFLKAGRTVLFSGTPCQIAALRLFLHKDWGSSLITVEVICHGVPSPRVWSDYLTYITRPSGADKNTVSISLNAKSAIADISMRDKRLGWQKYGFRFSLHAHKGVKNSVSDSPKRCYGHDPEIFFYHQDNPYFWAFNTDLILRPSCFKCPSKCGKSGADIAMGDFWHISEVMPDFNDDKGVSLLLAYSPIGTELIKSVDLQIKPTDYSTAIQCVPSITRTERRPIRYDHFWSDYTHNGIITLLMYFKKYRFTPLEKFVKRPIKKLIGDSTIPKIKKYLFK